MADRVEINNKWFDVCPHCGKPKRPKGIAHPNPSCPVNTRPTGRWPSNCAFSHFAMTLPSGEVWGCHRITEPAPCPACGGSDGDSDVCETCGGTGSVEVGAVERVKGSAPIGRPSIGAAYGESIYLHALGPRIATEYTDKDGKESVIRYACARHCECGAWWLSETATKCPECGEEGEWGCGVRRLGEDSGERPSGHFPKRQTNSYTGKHGIYGGFAQNLSPHRNMNDKGTAARFFPNPSWEFEAREPQFVRLRDDLTEEEKDSILTELRRLQVI